MGGGGQKGKHGAMPWLRVKDDLLPSLCTAAAEGVSRATLLAR